MPRNKMQAARYCPECSRKGEFVYFMAKCPIHGIFEGRIRSSQGQLGGD